MIKQSSANRNDGYVLPLVLVIISMLAVSIVVTTAYFNSSVRTIATASDRIRLLSLLDSGIELAAGRVMTVSEMLPSSGRFSYSMSVGTIEVEYIGENGRVDLNVADNDLLALVFRYAGMSEAESRLLLEKISSRRLGLGRDQDARLAGTPTFYQSVDEIIQQGMSKGSLDRIENILTVFSGQKQIDPRNADPIIFSVFPDLSGLKRRQLNILKSSKMTNKDSWVDAAGKYARHFSFEKGRVFRINTKAVLSSGMRGSSIAVILFYQDDDIPYRVLYRADAV